MNPAVIILGGLAGLAAWFSRKPNIPLGARATIDDISFAWTGQAWFPAGSDFEKARQRFKVGDQTIITALGQQGGQPYRWDGESFRPL